MLLCYQISLHCVCVSVCMCAQVSGVGEARRVCVHVCMRTYVCIVFIRSSADGHLG